MDELMSWCHAQRQMMLESIEALQTGRLRMGEITVNGHVDGEHEPWLT